LRASDYLDGLPCGDVPGAASGACVLAFDEARASAFAKGVAGDFNPLHDAGNKRFCVPGDLLFAALLQHYGLHEEVSVSFAGMLGAHSRLTLPAPAARGGRMHLVDERGREVLGYYASGERVEDATFIDRLSEEYVRFSGRTFPAILMPLMEQAGVMINPERPLIIYKDMAIRLDMAALAASLAERPAGQGDPGDPDDPDDAGGTLTLDATEHAFSADGKKGAASVRFAIRRGDATLGEGEKNFVLTGLRAFDAGAAATLLERHGERVAAHAARAARAARAEPRDV